MTENELFDPDVVVDFSKIEDVFHLRKTKLEVTAKVPVSTELIKDIKEFARDGEYETDKHGRISIYDMYEYKELTEKAESLLKELCSLGITIQGDENWNYYLDISGSSAFIKNNAAYVHIEVYTYTATNFRFVFNDLIERGEDSLFFKGLRPDIKKQIFDDTGIRVTECFAIQAKHMFLNVSDVADHGSYIISAKDAKERNKPVLLHEDHETLDYYLYNPKKDTFTSLNSGEEVDFPSDQLFYEITENMLYILAK